MIDRKKILQVAETLAFEANAEYIILFGSYASGDANKNSDVDLMIVAESDLPRFKRTRNLYKAIRPYPFAMQLIVYTPEEIEKGKSSHVSFVSNVLKEGKKIYVKRNRKAVAS